MDRQPDPGLARLQRYALAVWCWRARSRIACSPTKYAKPQWVSRCRSDSGRADVLPQLKAGTPLEVRLRPRQRQNARNRPGGSDDSQIDNTTGTVNVRAQFDNADNALFPNPFVNAQLLLKPL